MSIITADKPVIIYKGTLYLFVPVGFSIFKYLTAPKTASAPMMLERVIKNIATHRDVIEREYPPSRHSLVQVYEVVIAASDKRAILNRLSAIIRGFHGSYNDCNVFFIRKNVAKRPSYYGFDPEFDRLRALDEDI